MIPATGNCWNMEAVFRPEYYLHKITRTVSFRAEFKLKIK
jgi:hypothetical protein